MSGDNGETKTPEQLMEEKKTAFAERPNDFVDMKDMLWCVLRNPKGKNFFPLPYLIGECTRLESAQVIGLTTYNLSKNISMVEAKVNAMAVKEQKIVLPGQHKKAGGFFGKKRF